MNSSKFSRIQCCKISSISVTRGLNQSAKSTPKNKRSRTEKSHPTLHKFFTPPKTWFLHLVCHAFQSDLTTEELSFAAKTCQLLLISGIHPSESVCEFCLILQFQSSSLPNCCDIHCCAFLCPVKVHWIGYTWFYLRNENIPLVYFQEIFHYILKDSVIWTQHIKKMIVTECSKVRWTELMYCNHLQTQVALQNYIWLAGNVVIWEISMLVIANAPIHLTDYGKK